MAEKKWPKWVIGVSSVLAFTGFLSMTQPDHSDSGVVAKKHRPDPDILGDIHERDSERDSGWGDAKAEGFVFEAQKPEQMTGWPHKQKSKREQLLEELQREDDPDKEITIPAPTDRSGQRSTGSNLQTRRS